MLVTANYNEAQEMISYQKVGVVPTDTVYGICAIASSLDAVKKLYSIKNRHQKPGTVLAASIDQLVSFGLQKRYLKAVSQYWPSAVSVVIPVGQHLSYLHLGRYSLAIRIPNNKKLIDLLKSTGPLLTSSANMPNKKPANSINEAIEYFGERVDFYLDGGYLANKPSTIIRIVDDAVEVLREGIVKINEQTGEVINDF